MENTTYEVVGIRESTYTFDDGRSCTGLNLYLTSPLDKGEGLCAERYFLTNEKLKNSGFIPKLGDALHLTYNRFGKVQLISRAE